MPAHRGYHRKMLRRSSRLAPIARRALPAAVRLPARAVAGSAAGNQQATADSGKFDALDLPRPKFRVWADLARERGQHRAQPSLLWDDTVQVG